MPVVRRPAHRRRRSWPSSVRARGALKDPATHGTTTTSWSSAGGPSGAACAYWLAEAGHDVVVVEKKHFPRVKTCGDGLTPRAVKQLDDMGLADVLARPPPLRRACAPSPSAGPRAAVARPPRLPRHGYVITRHDLDQIVAERAEKAGATVLQGMEAVEPAHRGGVRGRDGQGQGRRATPRAPGHVHGGRRRGQLPVRAGPGHAPATGPTPWAWPSGATSRRPAHDEPWIESHLDVRDQAATSCPATAGSSRWATAG